jgi:hypothetical protein
MPKNIYVKITASGYRNSAFNVTDDTGEILATNVPVDDLIAGVWYEVEDEALTISLESVGVCNFIMTETIEELYADQIAALTYTATNTGTLWSHLTDTTLNNNYYGVVEPYVIEYPFMYSFHDEILQNVKDFTRAFKYLPIPDGVFNDNAKVEVDDQYFNKVIIYNGNQCTGLLQLVPKPANNLSAYMQYPIYLPDSKVITYTKTDSFYQYNTFWSVLRNRAVPMFRTSCESLSIDKVLNQTNMDYTTRSFKKETMRGKGVLIRHILDNTSDVHLVSQFIIAPSQISYK